jgi:hypothetical protein
MNPFVTAGTGFLLAVLWMDLMFDVQVLRAAGAVPAQTLASISAYYARVTTAARPMNRLIALVMLATIAAAIAEVAGDGSAAAWASLALLAAAIALAGARTVPAAVRLGEGRDEPGRQSELARAILREHIFCACSLSAVMVLQLVFA